MLHGASTWSLRALSLGLALKGVAAAEQLPLDTDYSEACPNYVFYSSHPQYVAETQLARHVTLYALSLMLIICQ